MMAAGGVSNMHCGIRVGLLAVAVAGVCAGHGVVEAGSLAGAAAGAAQADKGVGAAAGKGFGRKGESLWQRKGPAPRRAGAARAPTNTERRGQADREQPPGTAAPAATAKAFAGITAGMDADELRARLGPASSRIVMAEEEQIVEIRRFRTGGRELGSVRLVDGKVTEVRPARK
jgi:hypothetical protein